MNPYAYLISRLQTPPVLSQFDYLYGHREGMLLQQNRRYTSLLKIHEEVFGDGTGLRLISAPGRTEIGGNHTDHNRGKVLAAAVNLDTLAAVTPREDSTVCIHSEGYAPFEISLEDLTVREEEKGTTAALVRGVAARMQELGHRIGGFNAAITSTVAAGSGLSSSASVEVLLCAIFDELYNGGKALDYKQRGIIARYAENAYFGKPCGLMDQMASSAGGLVAIDFAEDNPEVSPISFDFAEKDYALVVVNSGGSHDDLTPDYAAVPEEMHKIAAFFGKENLRPIMPERFYKAIPQIREAFGTGSDRAILRAAHFFEENKRVTAEVAALKSGSLEDFLRLVKESGLSSFCYLQNIYPSAQREELSLALMLSEKALHSNGAWRVHGGGFAGTTLNFVPSGQIRSFVEDMEAVFGRQSCHVLDIRPVGPAVIHFEG